MTKEEATKRIRERMDKWALDNEDIEALSEAIPELRESEDERIRKKIVNLLERAYKFGDASITGNDYNEIATWLEKQKEQDEKPSKPELKTPEYVCGG